ncbi:MAG TPA: peptide deformylase [Candidatus Saccharimonadia bacterium]|nr:peptide deformylase [Candidatus Saccharimonadia bacterium]
MPKTHALSAPLALAEWTAIHLPKVRFFGDSVLYTPCRPFAPEEFGQPEMLQLADELARTLQKYRAHLHMGRGLAANQIGSDRQLVVVWQDDEAQCLVNLRLLDSTGRGRYQESCISSGSMWVGSVIRPWKATFEYFTVDGQRHVLEANELQTRVLLHELDHLQGEICADKYEPGTTAFVTGGATQLLSYKLEQLDTLG